MAPTLPTANSDLDSSIADWQSRIGRPITGTRVLTGSGNQTRLLNDDEGNRYVLRVNGHTEHLGVNRSRELDIHELLKQTRITPACLHQSETYCVFEYLEMKGVATEYEISRALSILHKVNIPDWFAEQPLWNPSDTISDYLELLPEAGEIFTPFLREMQLLNWQSLHYGICHIDLNPTNTLNTRNGVMFIDWEYARYGPTVYDLAVLLETWRDLDEATLLQHYTLDVDPEWLSHNRRAYRVIETLWFAITNPEDWPITRLEQAARAV